MKKDTYSFIIHLNKDMLKKFDEAWKKKGYSTRSEAVRDLIRRFIENV